jgi:hypothetical protein
MTNGLQILLTDKHLSDFLDNKPMSENVALTENLISLQHIIGVQKSYSRLVMYLYESKFETSINIT